MTFLRPGLEVENAAESLHQPHPEAECSREDQGELEQEIEGSIEISIVTRSVPRRSIAAIAITSTA